MDLSIANLVKLGSTGVSAISDIVSDVEKGIAAGGGVAVESLAVVRNLVGDKDFEAHLVAFVDAIKAVAADAPAVVAEVVSEEPKA